MRVVLAYKNFAANRNISHIGLGVAAMNTAKVLRRDGITADVWPIVNAGDLQLRLQGSPADHVMISAPWIPSPELLRLSGQYPETQFSVVCHSNVGFLQADRNGMRLVREVMELEQGTHNIHLAGNCRRFCDWVGGAFHVPCAFLPNLYCLENETGAHRPNSFQPGNVLRIGAFGAIRPLKNFMSAAAAALEIARTFRSPLELWMSGGRAEGGGETVLASIREMLSGLPGVTLVTNGWQSWPGFRKVVAHMHLLLQPSYTESFNMVTADGVAEGVASVVSPAIDWAPRYWQAEPDDVPAMARVGRQLLTDSRAAADGRQALLDYVSAGLGEYRSYLKKA